MINFDSIDSLGDDTFAHAVEAIDACDRSDRAGYDRELEALRAGYVQLQALQSKLMAPCEDVDEFDRDDYLRSTAAQVTRCRKALADASREGAAKGWS